ncbi:hypothetical protein DVX13_09305 [Enterococcus faecium]|nr:hypothetical protein DVX13_09305 [Enterococcus faecium]
MTSKNHSLLLSFKIEETVSSGKIVPSTSNYIICQIKRDKTFHLRNSKKLLMVFGNLVIF